MKKEANKMADIFADERISTIHLAQITARTFTPKMSERLHQFLRWHSFIQNGHQAEVHPLDLDNLAERE